MKNETERAFSMRISREELMGADLTGPDRTPEGDLFRSDIGVQVLLSERDGFPSVTLRGPDGSSVLVTGEDGCPLEEEALSTLLWERLETFDEVIERLAGPLPEV
jgi:hypothetical protein